MQLPTETILLAPRPKKPPRLVVVFLLLIAAGAAGYLVWDGYLSPAAAANRETSRRVDAWLAWEEEYKQAMREDTYGGKTPEETLALFVEALKKEDVELASKYFALNTNEKSEYYLTRKEWEQGLAAAKNEGRLREILDTVQNLKPSKAKAFENKAEYVLLDEKDIVDRAMYFELNKYTQVWKIESL